MGRVLKKMSFLPHSGPSLKKPAEKTTRLNHAP